MEKMRARLLEIARQTTNAGQRELQRKASSDASAAPEKRKSLQGDGEDNLTQIDFDVKRAVIRENLRARKRAHNGRLGEWKAAVAEIERKIKEQQTWQARAPPHLRPHTRPEHGPHI